MQYSCKPIQYNGSMVILLAVLLSADLVVPSLLFPWNPQPLSPRVENDVNESKVAKHSATSSESRVTSKITHKIFQAKRQLRWRLY